jgi:uncharacterized protein (TIGR03000 family)
MYSVVLMMALTGGADAPAFGHHGCNGGGCYGGGCYGGGYSAGSCYGGGCTGGGCHGGGGLFRHRRSRGCCGCSGGGCYGGGCYGSGYGGCCGTVSYGCTGGGCYGGTVIMGGGATGGTTGPKTGDGKTPEKIGKPKDGKSSMVPAPAIIVVSLPAQAKLTIDDLATKSTSAVRAFASPALTPGKQYYYTLKAEIVRDGRPVIDTQRVQVRAGEQTQVTFNLTAEAVASR